MPDGRDRLLAAGDHHRGVPADPARLRVHAQRRRRRARHQPHDEPAVAAQRASHTGALELDPVPARTRWRTRPRSSATSSTVLPARRGPLRVRADGARSAGARRSSRSSSGSLLELPMPVRLALLGRLQVRAADGRRTRSSLLQHRHRRRSRLRHAARSRSTRRCYDSRDRRVHDHRRHGAAGRRGRDAGLRALGRRLPPALHARRRASRSSRGSAIALATGENPRLRLETYFALTHEHGPVRRARSTSTSAPTSARSARSARRPSSASTRSSTSRRSRSSSTSTAPSSIQRNGADLCSARPALHARGRHAVARRTATRSCDFFGDHAAARST